MVWAARATRPIPAIGSREASLEINDYSLGMNSFLSNDKFPLRNGDSNLLRLAQNARITTLGEYGTRKGFDFHSVTAIETEDQSITSVTGAEDKAFSGTVRIAQQWTAANSGRLAKYQINISNPNGATGTVIVEHWTDDGGSPGELVSRSSIASSEVAAVNGYLNVRFPDIPVMTSTTVYWVIAYVQLTGTGSYAWGSTTSATTAKVSTDSGATWFSTLFAMNFKVFYTPTGAVKGLHRAYKSDGTSKTLFAHGTTLYSVDDVTGALTTVKSSLSASATHYRFVTVNDVVYYVNGYDGLRKWDFTTESQVSSTNYTHICEHKGMLFLATSLDANKIVFSNFADYETFTSTDFIYAPSPKTGDPVTALVSLNGYLLIFTRNNKFILSGSDNATYQLDEAPDQKGTYTQESVTQDKNSVYYLSDDGMYRSNGSEGQLMSEGAYQAIMDMPNKEEACTVINKGRIYLWHQLSGESSNSACYVWNLNYGQGNSDCLESYDTDAFVCRAVNAFKDDENLIVGSSVAGQVLYQERASNDYTNLGGDIDFLLQTHYMTFDNPASLKEIRYWDPRFGAQSGNYNISSEYATDLRDNWTTYGTTNVQGSGYIWGDAGTVWGSFTWGTTAELQAQLYVPGEYRRIALRYKHFATRQPQKFLGHSLKVQGRRMR